MLTRLALTVLTLILGLFARAALPRRRPDRYARTDRHGRVVALVAEGEECLPCGKTAGTLEGHFGATGGSVTTAKWNGSASRFNTDQYKMACAACDPGAGGSGKTDPTVKAGCFLPHHEPGGAINRNGVHSAAQRFSALKGHDAGAVKRAAGHLRSHYSKDLKETAPDAISASLNDVEALAQRRLDGGIGEATFQAELAKACDRIDAWSAENPGYALTEDEEEFAHASFTGKHTHPHSAMGDQGTDTTHTHEHSHSGTASHDHSHAAATTETVERVTPVSMAELPAKLAEVQANREARGTAVERTAVTASLAPDLVLELPVRWDEDARTEGWVNEDGTVGKKGAFVSTLPEGVTAATVPAIVDNPGAAWHAVLCVEGLRTDETPPREIVPGACQFPDLPVSLRLQIHDEGGHYGAVTCGRIDTMERQEKGGYNAIVGAGVFGTDEFGQTAQLLVTEQTQRFISIDPRDVTVEIIEIETRTSSTWFEEPDESTYQCWVRYSSLTIGAATIVATPALQQSVIALATVELPDTPIAVQRAQADATVASAAHRPSILEQPPPEWFADPGFYVGDPRLVRQHHGFYACPLTVTEDGEVYGHVAYWGAEHTGRPGQRPPRSTSYAYFTTGVREVDTGEKVPVGQLTMGCGHANINLTGPRAAAHYRNPAHYDGGYGAVQVADVTAGEDDFGIWVHGALRPTLSAEDRRKFEAMALSGDWRTFGGDLNMVACLAVPVPGFPISRTDVLVAAAEVIDSYAARAGIDATTGAVLALVAAGRVQPRPVADRLAALEVAVGELQRQSREQAAAQALSALDELIG